MAEGKEADRCVEEVGEWCTPVIRTPGTQVQGHRVKLSRREEREREKQREWGRALRKRVEMRDTQGTKLGE